MDRISQMCLPSQYPVSELGQFLAHSLDWEVPFMGEYSRDILNQDYPIRMRTQNETQEGLQNTESDSWTEPQNKNILNQGALTAQSMGPESNHREENVRAGRALRPRGVRAREHKEYEFLVQVVSVRTELGGVMEPRFSEVVRGLIPLSGMLEKIF